MNFIRVNENRDDYVDCFAMLKSVVRKISNKGEAYLDITLSDSNSEINAKLWQYSEAKYGIFESNHLVKVRGYLTKFNDALQIKIENIRYTCASDNVNIKDFIKSAPYDSNNMLNSIKHVIEHDINDNDYKLLLKTIYSDYEDLILSCPAARSMHHAVYGGLLYHTLSMLRVAQALSNIYTSINKDLLCTGVLLHDIGKIEEFGIENAKFGSVSEYSKSGKLLGHLVLGINIVSDYGKRLDIDSDKILMLQHLLASHHGQLEWGACVEPQTLEAEVLSQIDVLDAKVNKIINSLEEIGDSEFTAPIRALNGRQFYKSTGTILREPNIISL